MPKRDDEDDVIGVSGRRDRAGGVVKALARTTASTTNPRLVGRLRGQAKDGVGRGVGL